MQVKLTMVLNEINKFWIETQTFLWIKQFQTQLFSSYCHCCPFGFQFEVENYYLDILAFLFGIRLQES